MNHNGCNQLILPAAGGAANILRGVAGAGVLAIYDQYVSYQFE